MSTNTILLSAADGVATLTLNRPEHLNAITPEMLSEIGEALTTISAPDAGVRCLLISGAGRAFCSGADLAQGMIGGGDGGDDVDMGEQVASGLRDHYHPVFQQIAALKIPIVTAVNGPAAGAGMSLAIIADFVIAAKSAYFLQAFVNIGLVPDSGSTYMLPRLIGKARATRMMMMGEKIPAELAEDWGLIYKAVDDDDLMTEAGAVATRMAAGPTVAMSCIRRAIAESDQNDFAGQLELEAEAQTIAARTEDCVEGVGAFLQKRPAAFKGR